MHSSCRNDSCWLCNCKVSSSCTRISICYCYGITSSCKSSSCSSRSTRRRPRISIATSTSRRSYGSRPVRSTVTGYICLRSSCRTDSCWLCNCKVSSSCTRISICYCYGITSSCKSSSCSSRSTRRRPRISIATSTSQRSYGSRPVRSTVTRHICLRRSCCTNYCWLCNCKISSSGTSISICYGYGIRSST